MDPKPHAEKLPPGYMLTTWLDGNGKTWRVVRADGSAVVQGQKTPKRAVELALALIK